MKVENVWVSKFQSGKLLGFADITFSVKEGGNGVMKIRGFKIFKSDDGRGVQVALPSKKDDKGEFRPLVSLEKDDPDSKELMSHITEKVAIAFNSFDSKQNSKPQNSISRIQDDPDPSGIPF